MVWSRLLRRNSLLRQFLVPIVLAVLATGVTVASLSKWASDQWSLRASRDRMLNVGRLVAAAPFPLTPTVLEQLRRLSGLDFLVLPQQNDANPIPLVTTKDLSRGDVEQLLMATRPKSDEEYPIGSIQIGKEGFRFVLVPTTSQRLVVLENNSQRTDGWQSFALPLITGVVSSLAIGVVATWTATKLVRRIEQLQEEVARIANGDFTKTPLTGPDDNIRSLQSAIHRMSDRLESNQREFAMNERSRLIHMIASGLAHELRNHMAGAKLALQTCDSNSADSEAVQVALKQLELAEAQIRRLLAVRSNAEYPGEPPLPVADIVSLASDLVRSTALHRGVQLDVFPPSADGDTHADIIAKARVPAGQLVVGALMNLLVNAMEAAGSHGASVKNGMVQFQTCLQTRERVCSWYIRDNGPGPSEKIAASMFDPFATTKPEGVGLGLAMCQRVAEQMQGSITWQRRDDWTEFHMQLPIRIEE